MCWPQRVPRSVQLQHPHSVNKPNTTGNQLQLLLLPPTPCWSSPSWLALLTVLHSCHSWDSASYPLPRATPTLAPCAVQFIYELRCDFSTAIWAAPLRLLRFTSLRFGLLAFTFFSSSLCASLLHFIWLACNLFLAAFCWPFIMLCYLAVNLCPLHVAKFRDRSNKLGNSASLMYFHFDSICFCLCVTISRVSQCVYCTIFVCVCASDKSCLISANARIISTHFDL